MITGVKEYLPVTMSFIAAKGCVRVPFCLQSILLKSIIQDLMLFDLIAALQDAGIVRPVKTGSRLF